MRAGAFKWPMAVGLVLSALLAKGCMLPFDHYEVGDVCDAGRDAGLDLPTASDPVLRGCDAGTEPKKATDGGK